MDKEKYIKIRANGKEVQIPNSWEVLTSDHYLKLINYLLRMGHGELSPAEVRIYFLCDIMGWDVHKIRRDDAMENLIAISEQLTFIFRRVEDDIKVDLCFCKQQLPIVFVDKKPYKGYEVQVDYNTLTCSLRALQYIEARQLLDMGEESLPLLAAILYYPGEYSSEGAQKLARQFAHLPATTLQAIALNFEAVNNFIFLKTEFSLLTKFKPQSGKQITTDATDALYDLSKDGLGNVMQVERMDVLTYLRILRKKTIEGARSLKASGMDIVKISTEMGLPIEVVRQIV